MNKLIGFTAVLSGVLAQESCSSEISGAYSDCLYSHGPSIVGTIFDDVQSYLGHVSICYGVWPKCAEIQKIAVSSSGNCLVEGDGKMVALNTLFTPCEDPLPPYLFDTQLYTANGYILSEYYGALYTDIVRDYPNEHFTYNITSQTLLSKSNGQCIEAVPNSIYSPANGGTLKTSPCDYQNDNQRWIYRAKRLCLVNFKFCIKTENLLKQSSPVRIDNYLDINSVFTNGTTAKSEYFRIVSPSGKRISEFYTGLYYDDAKNNLNEIFTFFDNENMIRSVTSDQCLDAFLDYNGKYSIHTYLCTTDNSNQQWIYHADTKQIEHKTHTGLCLDGDPTFTDHHLQVYECSPNNPNQQWNFEYLY
ncbi:hypothetical protein THRCLA_06641 [Thraustotheca clavata]|uniref:Secreted protein n=1 Tax=Thraustotheca clavata TaxID=74557 RepID=A0A0A7CLG3_9STRA|nr:secreted protein [Thraustotheca clavata]OQR98914.1 hypothetical protein THRCLA_06641 [Thraustotheca clavata]